MYWYRSIIAHTVGRTSPQVRLNVSAYRDVLCRARMLRSKNRRWNSSTGATVLI